MKNLTPFATPFLLFDLILSISLLARFCQYPSASCFLFTFDGLVKIPQNVIMIIVKQAQFLQPTDITKLIYKKFLMIN